MLPDALRREHRVLCKVIAAAIGPQQLHDVRRMLQRILWSAPFRVRVIDAVLDLESRHGPRPHSDARKRLLDLPPSELTTALITGLETGTDRRLLRWPMPNLLFARDCFAVAGPAIALGYPRHPARQRDGLLARAIVRHHPLFAATPRIDIESPADSERSPADVAHFEGGDLVLPAPGVALIGIGIRTNLIGAQRLAVGLRKQGFGTVLGIHLPMRRGAMHLDTLFTLADRDTCVMYDHAFSPDAPDEDRVRIVDLFSGDELGCDLVGVLADVGVTLRAIPCGDGDPVAAAREQWTDGANAFCLGPGRIVLYARNQATLRALNKAGFRILEPAEFCRNAALLMTGERRFVVALSGFELPRGRGGPRCLTLPLSRLRAVD